MATSGISGAGSINVDSIVEQLMTIERQGLTKFVSRERSYTTKIATWSGIRGSLSNLQGTLASLRDLASYSATKGTVSSDTYLTASTTASAAAGTHTVRVDALAEAHRVASGIVAGPADVIGGGTLEFQFGTYSGGGTTFGVNASRPSASVTIAPGATVQDIVTSVNQANVGVSATIVNDGTGDRLVFSSKFTGAANALKITTIDDDTTNTDTTGLSRLVFDPAGGISNLSQLTAGVDASALVDGLAITSASNTLDKTIAGVTINLKQAGASSTTTINIARDLSSVKTSITNFVKAYNEAQTAMNDAGKYDPATRRAGPLNGDASLRGLQTQIRNSLFSSLSVTPGDYQMLADIGIKTGAGGQLTVDGAKLDTALTGDASKVARLLARAGATDSSAIAYNSSSDKTVSGNYDLAITAVATQANIVGSAAANLTIVTGVNDTLDVTIDGRAGSITLPAGTYATPAALIADVQSRINGIADFSANNAGVTVTQSGGVLTMTSNRYGTASTVAIAGNAATDMFGGAPVATGGVDVAGTVGGIAGVGEGRTLTVTDGAPTDLSLTVSATTTGTYGSVRVYTGFAARLESILKQANDSTKGLFKTRIDGLDKSVQTGRKDSAALESRLVLVEARYRRQFEGLNAALARMNFTQNYLTGQLNQIAANNGSAVRR